MAISIRDGLEGDEPASRVLGVDFNGFTNDVIHLEVAHDIGSCVVRVAHLDWLGITEKGLGFGFPFWVVCGFWGLGPPGEVDVVRAEPVPAVVERSGAVHVRALCGALPAHEAHVGEERADPVSEAHAAVADPEP